MSVKIQKWGNSLGVRIPKSVIEKANLIENSMVEIENKNGGISIFPARAKFTLNDLLSDISKDNLPDKENFAIEGKEIW
jgi:antitoxin MazE